MLLKLCTADVMYVMRYMDNVVSNPYEVWRQMSSPDYPTLQQLAQLRGQEVIHTHTPLLEFQDTCTSAVCVFVFRMLRQTAPSLFLPRDICL